MATVIGAMPHYGQVHPLAAASFWARASRQHRWMASGAGGSLLAHVFNVLWAQMLLVKPQTDPDYFAMLHSDVVPEAGWVDTLVDELRRTGADLVSVVLPIKNLQGVTSTAIDDPEDEWTPLRRLTTTEVQRLPETFSAADCGYPGRALLVNTGCWVCDLHRPWVEEFPGFEIRDKIRRRPDGAPQAVCVPEDWNFSRWLHARGAKVLATRKVRAEHVGTHAFANDSVWGAPVDHAYSSKHGGGALPGLADHAAAGVADGRGGAVPGGAGGRENGAGGRGLEGAEHGGAGANGVARGEPGLAPR